MKTTFPANFHEIRVRIKIFLQKLSFLSAIFKCKKSSVAITINEKKRNKQTKEKKERSSSIDLLEKPFPARINREFNAISRCRDVDPSKRGEGKERKREKGNWKDERAVPIRGIIPIIDFETKRGLSPGSNRDKCGACASPWKNFFHSFSSHRVTRALHEILIPGSVALVPPRSIQFILF